MKIIADQQYHKDIMEYYSSFFQLTGIKKIEKIDLTIIVTKDFFNDYIKQSFHFEREIILKQKPSIENLNGAVRFSDNSKKFNILLNAHKFVNSKVTINTLFHELTHVHDYYNFNCAFGNYMADNSLREIPSFTDFCYWSEFHAYQVGLLSLTSVQLKQSGYSIFNFKDINPTLIKIEFDSYTVIEAITKLQASNKSSFRNLFYNSFYDSLMRYYGRISIFGLNLTVLDKDPNSPILLIQENFSDFGILIFDVLANSLKNNTFPNFELLTSFRKEMWNKSYQAMIQRCES